MTYTIQELACGLYQNLVESEVDLALEVCREHNWHLAHFGINGCFIFGEATLSVILQ